MLMAFYLANKEKKILATGNAPFYSSCVARKGIRKKSLSARVVESVLVQRPLLTSKNLEAIAQTVVLLFPELSLARLFSYSLQGRKETKITSSRDKAKEELSAKMVSARSQDTLLTLSNYSAHSMCFEWNVIQSGRRQCRNLLHFLTRQIPFHPLVVCSH